MGGGDVEQINNIEIETLNRCNGRCSFCPVNVNQPQRKYAKMSEDLFRKIINELADMNYTKGISLFSNNEPFLDERIIEFHKYANEKLPRAVFWLFTNGTVLTLDKFLEIMPYLDGLIIDNYNDEKKLITPEIQKICDYIQGHPDLKDRVELHMRLQNEVLATRGGLAPNRIGDQDKYLVNASCTLPFRQLVVRPTGEVSLCCCDALGKYTMGDLNVQTIKEIWNSEKYKSIRAELTKNGRKNLLLCDHCDAPLNFGLYTERKRPIK